MQIALDPAPRLVPGRDDARPRSGQLGPAPLELGCPLDDLHLEQVSSVAKLCFRPPALVEQAGALKCSRSVIRSEGKQQLVDLGREVETLAGRSNQTALGVDADGNDHTAAWLHAADIGNDLLTG